MKYAAKVLSEKETLAWGLPPMMTEYIPEHILNIEGKWGKDELQTLCVEYSLDPYGNKDVLVRKLLYIGALDKEGQLTELPVQMSEAGHVLVAPYLIGPPKKFCCRICGECAPADLLKEGMFQERIQWLREHYQKTHPGKWGRHAVPAIVVWSTQVSKEIHYLETLRRDDPEAFYRYVNNLKAAIEERKKGQTKKMPEFSLSELEDIVKQANLLYR